MKQGSKTLEKIEFKIFLDKSKNLPNDIHWHFLGHIQKNKINKIKDQFTLIQSIDSLQIAEKLSNVSTKVQPVLIQIKTTDEVEKTGFFPKDFKAHYKTLMQLKNLEIQGLMTLGPKEGDARASFRILKELKEEFCEPQWKLSMGMSQDYEIAIEEGASIIRIGRRSSMSALHLDDQNLSDHNGYQEP